MLNKFFNKKRNIFGLQINDWVLLAIGLAIFTVITLWTITKSSIWFDEAFGAYMIRFNFADIFKYTAADVHPPLFYLLLKLWSLIFGNTELALRSMSLFFGAVTIVFGYLLANRLFDKKIARISLLFMILSPMLIRYGQEMRMYALVAAIGLAATYVLTIAVESKKRLPWIIYGILIALGMWTHYLMAIVWISHWVWRADCLISVGVKKEFFKKFFSKQWIMAHIIAVASFLPWVPFFIAQIFNIQVNGFWIPPVTPDTIPNFMTNTIFYQDVGNVTGWLAFGFIIIVVLVVIWSLKICKLLIGSKQRQSYRLIFWLAAVPVLLLFLSSMPPLRSSFVDRYLICSAVAISIFVSATLGLGLKFMSSKLRILVALTITAFMLLGVTNVWHFGNYSKTSNASNNTREIVKAAIDNSSSNEPIIADSPWLFYEAIFYATDKHPVYFIDANTQYPYGSLDMLKYNDQHKIKDIALFTKQNPIVWYIGLPRGADFKSPYSNWRVLHKEYVNDSINGKPAYEAIRYAVINRY